MDASAHVVARNTWGLADSGSIHKIHSSSASAGESAVLLRHSLLSNSHVLERKNLLLSVCLLKIKKLALNYFSATMSDAGTLWLLRY